MYDRWRSFGGPAAEFLRGAAEDDQPVRLLVAAEPQSTGDARFDALLAAIAENLCVHSGGRAGRTLELGTIDEVVEVVERYFPDEPLSDRSRLLVEDLLNAVHQVPEPAFRQSCQTWGMTTSATAMALNSTGAPKRQ